MNRRRMMALAAATALAAEGVALACSCLNTDDPAELRRLAGESAKGAIALVEAEAVTTFQQTPAGEEMKILRTLAGQAPARFRVERGPVPSSASCDMLYQPGQPELIILYPASNTGTGLPLLRTSGLCTDVLLEKPLFRDMVAGHIIGPAHAGERG